MILNHGASREKKKSTQKRIKYIVSSRLLVSGGFLGCGGYFHVLDFQTIAQITPLAEISSNIFDF